MWEDPIVDEVRKIRKDLEAEFNFDAKSIFKDIRNRQSLHGEKLVNLKVKKGGKPAFKTSQNSSAIHPDR